MGAIFPSHSGPILHLVQAIIYSFKNVTLLVLMAITIFDFMVRDIKTLMNGTQTVSFHSIRWDARNDMGEGVSAGMYIYTILAGEFRAMKKMVLLK